MAVSAGFYSAVNVSVADRRYDAGKRLGCLRYRKSIFLGLSKFQQETGSLGTETVECQFTGDVGLMANDIPYATLSPSQKFDLSVTCG
jgi:hypothetical protein